MSWLLAEIALTGLLVFWRHRSSTAHLLDDDAETWPDPWRVLDDLERIDGMLDDGRIREARDELGRLIDAMSGNDEAVATDARWAEMQGRRAVA